MTAEATRARRPALDAGGLPCYPFPKPAARTHARMVIAFDARARV